MKKFCKKKIVQATVLGIIVASVGLLVYEVKEYRNIQNEKKIAQAKELEQKREIELKKIEEENKKLEEKKKIEESKKPENIKKEILKIVPKDKLEKIGISFYNLKTNEGFDINGDKYFTAASTYKIPMNIVLYDKVLKGKIAEDTKLRYAPSDYEEGAGIMQNDKNLKSKSYSIKELTKNSIVYSDNIASRMINRFLGGYTNMRKEFDKLLGYKTESKGNIMTANIARDAYKILYNSNNKYYKEILKLGKETIFNNRISRDIPRDKVSHKIGDYNGFSADIGIVEGKQPYILAIYTNGYSGSYDKMAEISKKIYNIMEKSS